MALALSVAVGSLALVVVLVVHLVRLSPDA
jgi:hypothetical protein